MLGKLKSYFSVILEKDFKQKEGQTGEIPRILYLLLLLFYYYIYLLFFFNFFTNIDRTKSHQIEFFFLHKMNNDSVLFQ